MARTQNAVLALSKDTLLSCLDEAKLLVKKDAGRTTTKATICGTRLRVIALALQTVVDLNPPGSI